eukprot:4580261-Amphidinium_carterae.1
MSHGSRNAKAHSCFRLRDGLSLSATMEAQQSRVGSWRARNRLLRGCGAEGFANTSTSSSPSH